MCGIAGGVWSAGGEPVPSDVLKRMTDVIAHRGPDGDGFHCETLPDGAGVALGHRRLAIIDLSGGHQPLSNEDGTVWVTFNGEIYNYKELRPVLEARGHKFRTDSDTETIVHMYEEYGTRCVEQMRGMFAFAVWDSQHRTLFLARDRMGEKPLLYRLEDHRLLFCSELKSLLQVPGVPRNIDPVAIDDFLTYLYIPHPRTIFRGVQKLPPAHWALWRDGKLQMQRYWNPDFNSELQLSPGELRERLTSTLDESVRQRLRSDVPLGAFLSGGIDSTVIVGMMQRQMSSPAKTYTIGFPISEFDESPVARQTAAHLKTDHHELRVAPDAVKILPKLAWHYDEPYADSSAIPTYYVSQITREHVKVALTGDGGDELFAGYPRYQTVQSLARFDRLPRFMRSLIANPVWKMLPGSQREDSRWRKLQHRMSLLRQPPERRYVSWVSNFQEQQRRALYHPEFATHLEGHHATDFLAEAFARCQHREPGTQGEIVDLLTYLPGDLLHKVDIASMAHGLECRTPFLDHPFVELALSIPFARKVHQGRTKNVLIETFRGFFTPEVLAGKKRGFRVPLDHWFRHELKDDTCGLLLDSRSLSRGYFAPKAVEKLLQQHLSGEWDHGDRIWALLCLELWHQTFYDQ